MSTPDASTRNGAEPARRAGPASAGDRVRWWLATCGGAGLAPGMPGTVAALWGVAIFLPIAAYSVEPWQSLLLGLALLAACGLTLWLAGWSERWFGEEDSGKFTTDEVAGFLLTVLLFRAPHLGATALWAFVVTRVIDILKVPPARRLERLPGGWGVLADDLLSSCYAAALLHAVRWAFPAWFLPG